MKTVNLFAALLLPALTHAAPDLDELLRRCQTSATAYAGDVVYTQWGEGSATAQEARVFVSSPARYRVEYLSPAGTVQRMLIGRGEKTLVVLPHRTKPWRGPNRCAATPQQMNFALSLLKKNYAVSTPARDGIAGRSAWKVELRPHDAGKPHQIIWFDEKTGVVLASRRFLPNTPYAGMARFVRFDTDGDFRDAPDAPTEDSPDGWTEETPAPAPTAQRLPAGFALVRENRFWVDGESVEHRIFSDGLARVSFFVTRRPVEGRTTAPRPPRSAALPVRAHTEAHNGQTVTVVGDGDEALLNTLWRAHVDSWEGSPPDHPVP